MEAGHSRLVRAGVLALLGAAGSGACGKGTTELALGTVGDTMAYDTTQFTVKTGARVHLILRNNGTQPTMQHNWTLVRPGTEATVIAAGLAAGPSQSYIPANNPDILAHTALSQPGGAVDTTFTAPAPGTYPFFCLFPGHVATMRGTLTVTP